MRVGESRSAIMPSDELDARKRPPPASAAGRSPVYTRARARSSADRASVFGTEGRGFESLRARHIFPITDRAFAKLVEASSRQHEHRESSVSAAEQVLAEVNAGVSVRLAARSKKQIDR